MTPGLRIGVVLVKSDPHADQARTARKGVGGRRALTGLTLNPAPLFRARRDVTDRRDLKDKLSRAGADGRRHAPSATGPAHSADTKKEPGVAARPLHSFDAAARRAASRCLGVGRLRSSREGPRPEHSAARSAPQGAPLRVRT
ncbi:MAG: hypothetical protein EBR82_30540 [Caulobacteraceae bacterium]|nr:hypothetical protein [Caulobacteraceae bacterium]